MRHAKIYTHSFCAKSIQNVTSGHFSFLAFCRKAGISGRIFSGGPSSEDVSGLPASDDFIFCRQFHQRSGLFRREDPSGRTLFCQRLIEFPVVIHAPPLLFRSGPFLHLGQSRENPLHLVLRSGILLVRRRDLDSEVFHQRGF